MTAADTPARTPTATRRNSVKSARRISAESAAGLVKCGDWLDYGAGLGQPDAFDKALAGRASELSDVNIRGCLSTRPRSVVES